MLRGLVTAIRTLTVFSVPGRDAEKFSSSLYWFPVVVAFLGTLLAATAWIGVRLGWNELAAVGVVVGGLLLTRGMHADGLADMADGFWGGRGERERILSIMKGPAVGSFGALALVSLLMLKWVVVLRLLEDGAFAVIAAGVLLGRLSQVVLASSLPYARQNQGTASGFVDGAGLRHAFSASALSLILLFPFFADHPLLFVLLTTSSIVVVLGTGLLSRRKIGGVTGDVLGAVSEVTELLVWLVAGLKVIPLS